MITAQLTVNSPISGDEYRSKLKEYRSQGLSRGQAIDKLDSKLKDKGYDTIDDNWQIAVFDPSQIKIVNS